MPDTIVYELVDVTDETYWTIGLYSSEARARAVIAACDGCDGHRVNTGGTADIWADEAEALEIRLRPIDQPSHADGDVVARFRRTWHWSDDEMHEVWETEEEVRL